MKYKISGLHIVYPKTQLNTNTLRKQIIQHFAGLAEVRPRMTLVWNMAQSDGAISVFLIFKSLRQSHHTTKLFHTPMSTFVAIAVLSYSLYGIYIPLHSVFTKQVDLNVRQWAPISQHKKLPDIPIGHSFRLVIVPILLLHSSCSEKSPVGWYFLLSIPLTIRTISAEPLQKTLMLLQSFKELSNYGDKNTPLLKEVVLLTQISIPFFIYFPKRIFTCDPPSPT